MKLIPYMVLNTIICLVHKINLKLIVIYRMTKQNLVKHTTIMECHINYWKKLNLTFWGMFCSFSFSKIIKIAFKGIKETDYLKYYKWLKAKISQNLSHKSTIEKKQTKTETSRSSKFFLVYITADISLKYDLKYI